MVIKSFLDLDAYKESFQLSLEIEELVDELPREEKYLLGGQMKRAARAIPALIAEGYAKRETIKVFQKFLRDAIGEANEMVNHLNLVTKKGYIKKDKIDGLIERYNVVGKKLTKLKQNWRNY